MTRSRSRAAARAVGEVAGPTSPRPGVIAEVVSYYPPHVGGMENVVARLSQELAACGHATEVFTSDAGPAGPAPDPQGGPRSGPVVHRLPSREVLHTPLIRGLFRRLLALPRGSILHVHVSQALTPEISWLVSVLRGLVLVCQVHLDVEPSSRVGNLLFRPYKKIFLGFVLRRSQRVIVFSTEQQGLMIGKYRLRPSRVVVVPNGVGEEFFSPAHAAVHPRLRLLYVGRLVAQKRVDRLIEAAALVPSVDVDIVGDGDLRTQLEDRAAASGARNVRFHGYLHGAELKRMYERSDAFVLTSDREGMPLVALEAMAEGLPVIGSNVIGIRELLSGHGILVDDPSPATFAATFARLNADPLPLLQAGALGRAHAEQFSWPRVIERILRTFEQAAHEWATADAGHR